MVSRKCFGSTPSINSGQAKLTARGFSLVELLVVVTIIVVLLSLLAPAMDRAIYQAELTVCGANLRTIGASILTYAAGNQRRYPYRPTLDLRRGQAHMIRLSTQYLWFRGPVADDRPYLRGYLDIKRILLDPFVLQTVNLDQPTSDLDEVTIFSSYSLWYGAQYPPNERAMKKMGDRFTRGNYSFSVLASDLDMIRTDQPWLVSSHPDYDGILFQSARQGDPDLGVTPYTVTQSAWVTASSPRRGPLDMNFALDDGSVARYYAVKYDAGDWSRTQPYPDPITGVPDSMTTWEGVWWNNLLWANR